MQKYLRCDHLMMVRYNYIYDWNHSTSLDTNVSVTYVIKIHKIQTYLRLRLIRYKNIYKSKVYAK